MGSLVRSIQNRRLVFPFPGFSQQHLKLDDHDCEDEFEVSSTSEPQESWVVDEMEEPTTQVPPSKLPSPLKEELPPTSPLRTHPEQATEVLSPLVECDNWLQLDALDFPPMMDEERTPTAVELDDCTDSRASASSLESSPFCKGRHSRSSRRPKLPFDRDLAISSSPLSFRGGRKHNNIILFSDDFLNAAGDDENCRSSLFAMSPSFPEGGSSSSSLRKKKGGFSPLKYLTSRATTDTSSSDDHRDDFSSTRDDTGLLGDWKRSSPSRELAFDVEVFEADDNLMLEEPGLPEWNLSNDEMTDILGPPPSWIRPSCYPRSASGVAYRGSQVKLLYDDCHQQIIFPADEEERADDRLHPERGVGRYLHDRRQQQLKLLREYCQYDKLQKRQKHHSSHRRKRKSKKKKKKKKKRCESYDLSSRASEFQCDLFTIIEETGEEDEDDEQTCRLTSSDSSSEELLNFSLSNSSGKTASTIDSSDDTPYSDGIFTPTMNGSSEELHEI